MDENISKFQEIKVLMTLIKHSDEKGNVEFYNTKVIDELGTIISNYNRTESLLFNLNESGVLIYEEIGEDGFNPIIFSSVSQHTLEYLASLIDSVNEEFDALEKRISEILNFNPKKLTQTIYETQSKLEEAHILVSSNEILQPFIGPLEEITHHFKSVKAISSNYDEIYKNIIRPMQEEGRSGIKATVKWAVISIVISTCISLVISNWSKVSVLLSGS